MLVFILWTMKFKAIDTGVGGSDKNFSPPRAERTVETQGLMSATFCSGNTIKDKSNYPYHYGARKMLSRTRILQTAEILTFYSSLPKILRLYCFLQFIALTIVTEICKISFLNNRNSISRVTNVSELPKFQ